LILETEKPKNQEINQEREGLAVTCVEEGGGKGEEGEVAVLLPPWILSLPSGSVPSSPIARGLVPSSKA
jgi:hypothetical protein